MNFKIIQKNNGNSPASFLVVITRRLQLGKTSPLLAIPNNQFIFSEIAILCLWKELKSNGLIQIQYPKTLGMIPILIKTNLRLLLPRKKKKSESRFLI